MADTGNMKLIREALVELVQFTCNSCQERLCESDCEEGGAPVPCSAILKARDALAEPPRACDVMSQEDLTNVVISGFMKSLGTENQLVSELAGAAISAAIKCAYDTQLVVKKGGEK